MPPRREMSADGRAHGPLYAPTLPKVAGRTGTATLRRAGAYNVHLPRSTADEREDAVAVFIPIVAIVMSLLIPIVYAIVDYRRRRDIVEAHHKERMAAIERGMDIPAVAGVVLQSVAAEPATALPADGHDLALRRYRRSHLARRGRRRGRQVFRPDSGRRRPGVPDLPLDRRPQGTGSWRGRRAAA